MKVRRGYRSKNVDDRRGRTGRTAAVAAGGGGIIAVIAALVFGLIGGGGGGINVDDVFGGLGAAHEAPGTPAQPPDPADDPNEQLRAISEFTLDDVQAMWGQIFAASGSDYPEATLVLFTGSTQSACGGADSRIGPHYCPPDQNVYIDLDFFRELESRFGAAGDFAEAYVIAHEVAHHVQNVTGLSSEVRALQQERPEDANELSVSLELQADCLAGVWASSAFQNDLLDPGDIDEALGAAAAVGDDRLGNESPESWTHGSAEQRTSWFREGFDTGDPVACDTF